MPLDVTAKAAASVAEDDGLPITRRVTVPVGVDWVDRTVTVTVAVAP